MMYITPVTNTTMKILVKHPPQQNARGAPASRPTIVTNANNNVCSKTATTAFIDWNAQLPVLAGLTVMAGLCEDWVERSPKSL